MSSLSSRFPDVQSFLGSAEKARGKLAGVNMMVIIVAIVLSIMTIHTHNKCRDDKKFKKSGTVKFMYAVSIIVLIFGLLLFVYDMGVKYNLFKM